MISDCRLTNADWRFDGGTDLQLPIADLKSAITRSSSIVLDRVPRMAKERIRAPMIIRGSASANV
jgi:hypothetical protein